MIDTDAIEHAGNRDVTVFFSYSRKDADAARPIIELLEQNGFAVWWDGMLGAGVKYVEHTESALQNARAVVVAWSSHAVGSHWVRDEAMGGRDTGRLVPISLDATPPPLGFRQFQVLDFSRWDGDPGATVALQLLRAVADLHGEDASAIGPAPSFPVERRGLTTRRQTIGLMALGGGALLTGSAGLAWWLAEGKEEAQDNSIAVLPFLNDGADEEQAYLVAGLASELRSILARNPALSIVARSSSEVVASRGLDAVSAARELGVAYIVEGSAQLADGLVRVSSNLIEGDTGIGRWSQTFSIPVDSLISLQTDLAEQIGSALTQSVSRPERDLQLGQASVPAAYDAYLRGWNAFTSSRDGEGPPAALRHFRNAARLDPGFAGARAGEAAAHLSLGHGAATSAQASAHYEAAVEAARRAVELGPDLTEAHSVLGQTLFEAQLKIAEAREPFERSMEFGSGSAGVLARYAEYEALTGQDAPALAAAERAARLDPLNPLVFKTLALVHYAAGRWQASIDQHRAALALEPAIGGSHAWIASSLLQLGRAREALAECKREPSQLLGGACLSIVHRALGDTASANEALQALRDEYSDAAAYQYAQVYAQWGEHRKAMEQLSLARQLGDAGLNYLKMDPMLDPLREREDFVRLQAGLGFQ